MATHSNSEALAGKVMDSRILLADLVEHTWHTELRAHATKLSDTIADVANFIWSSNGKNGTLELKQEATTVESLPWRIPIVTQAAESDNSSTESVILSADREFIDSTRWKPWKVDESRVEALLQLWMLQLEATLDVNIPNRNFLWIPCEAGDLMAGVVTDFWIGRGSTVVKNMSITQICEAYEIQASDGSPDYTRIIGAISVDSSVELQECAA